MSLLQVDILAHPGENIATYLSLMAGSIQKLAMENANIHSQLHETQEELQVTRHELKQSREELQAQLNTTTSSQNEIIATHQKMLEKATYTGTLPFGFTMSEFEQHKMANDKWYPPPLYTHTHMCIKVWACGWE